MKRLNRKTAVATIVMCLVLVVATILPMGAVAAESETGTVTGYGFVDNYYEADFANQKIVKATYGAWAGNEGSYNGAFMWSGDYEKVEVVKEDGTLGTTSDGKGTLPANGELTFVNPDNPSIKFYPGQISNNPLKEGIAYISFTIYYQSGTYKEGDTEKYYFPGVKFGVFENNSDNVIFSVDNTDGKVYIGNTPNYAKNDPNACIGQFKDGWNTVEMVFMPKDTTVDEAKKGNEGKLVTSAGDAKYGEDAWPVKRNTIYLRTSHESEPFGETFGFTDESLATSFAKLEFGKGRFYGGASSMGEISSIKPLVGKQGRLTFGGAKAVNLEAGVELLEVKYEGHDKLTQYVVDGSSNNTIFATPILDDTTNEPIKLWKTVTGQDDGGNDILAFYAPAVKHRPDEPDNTDNRMMVTRSMTLSVATGAEEQMGLLGQVMDKINPDLTVYTYVQLGNYITDLETTATLSQLAPTHSYIIRKDELVSALNERRDAISVATEALIAYVSTFDDKNAPLVDRIDYFLYADAIIGDCDATYYSDETGTTAEMSADAMQKYHSFDLIWNDVESAWMAYTTGLNMIVSANPGMDTALRYADILANYDIIHKAFTTFTLSDDITDGYTANFAAMKAEYDAKLTILDKFNYLSDWAENWNTFKKLKYGSRKVDLPTDLLATVNAYNEMVTQINNEILEVGIMTMAFMQELVDNEQGHALISDIRSKFVRKESEAFPEE